MNPPPVRGEVVPIRIQDPHSSPTMKRKPDTQHTLRPDRSGGKPKPAKDKEKKEKRKQSPESRRSDSPSSERKGPKSKKPTDKAKSSNAGSDYETGRFRKADTARKSKGKTPRIGRSRSTGNAMDDDASSIGRPTTPRGYEGYQAVPRVTADDYEDSDVESNLNYNPLRRSGSKSSLYASRSSLYGRRRRKGSMGSVHSLVAHDDLDFRERDSFKDRSLSRRDRNFRSLGDLEHELRDSTTRSTQTLRECATQTGTGFANVIPGKKTTVKKGRPKSVSSSHTQTAKSKNRKERNLDTSSSSSGVYKPRPRTNSASSTSRVKSRERRDSGSSVGAGKPRRAKSESELKKKLEAEDKKKKKPPTKPKPAPKPKLRPRKSTASVGNLSDDDAESVATGMTGPVDQSSVAGGYNPAMTGQPVYPPQAYPGYPMGYPPPQMPYGMVQFGQPGMPPMPGAVPMPGGPMHTRAVAPNAAGAGVPSLRPAAPGVAPKPSKWDQLCKITDSDKSPADSSGSGSTNVYGGHYFPPGYASAVGSEYGSERSGPARSTGQSQIPRKSSWHALKELADKEGSQYSASESNI